MIKLVEVGTWIRLKKSLIKLMKSLYKIIVLLKIVKNHIKHIKFQ